MSKNLTSIQAKTEYNLEITICDIKLRWLQMMNHRDVDTKSQSSVQWHKTHTVLPSSTGSNQNISPDGSSVNEVEFIKIVNQI